MQAYSRSTQRVHIVVGLPSAFCRPADGLPSVDRRATVGRPSGTDIIEIECKGNTFFGEMQIFMEENANIFGENANILGGNGFFNKKISFIMEKHCLILK